MLVTVHIALNLKKHSNAKNPPLLLSNSLNAIPTNATLVLVLAQLSPCLVLLVKEITLPLANDICMQRSLRPTCLLLQNLRNYIRRSERIDIGLTGQESGLEGFP